MRLSVGLEDVADLLADVQQALAKCTRALPRAAEMAAHALK
ncbi:methionine gamma-lyase [Mycobacterium tuberculosis]|nr:methionine gamma-lyase [Mycobacterium tuberculosis]